MTKWSNMSTSRKSWKIMERCHVHNEYYNLRSGSKKNGDTNKMMNDYSNNSQLVVVKEKTIKEPGRRVVELTARRRSARLSQLSQQDVLTCIKTCDADSKYNNHQKNQNNNSSMAEKETIPPRGWRVLELKPQRKSIRHSKLNVDEEEEEEEDTDDEAYEKRHLKFEIEERQKWELLCQQKEKRLQRLKELQEKREAAKLKKKKLQMSRQRSSTKNV